LCPTTPGTEVQRLGLGPVIKLGLGVGRSLGIGIGLGPGIVCGPQLGTLRKMRRYHEISL